MAWQRLGTRRRVRTCYACTPGGHLNYDTASASSYAASRTIHAGVLAGIIEEAGVVGGSRALEVGCGTGNYLRALFATTRCSVAGFDPSEDMLAEARRLGGVPLLACARAEDVARAHRPESFDLVFSVDVIHHVGDVLAFFAGAREILKPGGRICTVTDSEAIIRGRRPLSAYWPETVAHELRRYPPVDGLAESLARSGFVDVFSLTVSEEYRLRSAAAYERKAFSSLHLVDEEAFQRGLARLRADLARGPIVANRAYVLIWGTRP